MANILRQLFLFGSLLQICLGCSSQKEMAPNFLFILVDDLGYMDIGAYGSTFYETPNIDRLAAEGARFTNAYAACPVCSPTRGSIMTGKYPARLDITDWIPGRQSYMNPKKQRVVSQPFNLQLPLAEKTIAEALKENGYRTFFAGKWHLGDDENAYPQFQGFDINLGGHFRGSPPGGYFSPYQNPMLHDGPEGEYLTDRLGDECVSFLDQWDKNDPFFMFLSFYTVHNPQQGKPEVIRRFEQKAKRMGISGVNPYTLESKWIRDIEMDGNWKERYLQSSPVYASMVYSMDENVGKVLQKIRALGEEQNTVVIFMSDNGGLSTSEGSPTSNAPLRAGKGWLYEGGIREPMIIKWPKVVKGGTTVDAQVISTYFYPTMLEMAGIPLDSAQHMDGLSMLPILKGDVDAFYKPLFWHYPHYSNQGGRPGGAIRFGDYKLIEFYDTRDIELYNLRVDVSESFDLSKEMPERVAEMKQLLDNWRKDMNAKMPLPNPEYGK